MSKETETVSTTKATTESAIPTEAPKPKRTWPLPPTERREFANRLHHWGESVLSVQVERNEQPSKERLDEARARLMRQTRDPRTAAHSRVSALALATELGELSASLDPPAPVAPPQGPLALVLKPAETDALPMKRTAMFSAGNAPEGVRFDIAIFGMGADIRFADWRSGRYYEGNMMYANLRLTTATGAVVKRWVETAGELVGLSLTLSPEFVAAYAAERDRMLAAAEAVRQASSQGPSQ